MQTSFAMKSHEAITGGIEGLLRVARDQGSE
jgi:hypothetical protein